MAFNFQQKTMKKRTILLVEDDAAVRDIIKTAFEGEYHVLEASMCSEAVEQAGNQLDCALIDYKLPDGNGFDVLRALRETKNEVPAILMTAYGSEDLVIKALRAGATDFLKKPLSLSYLRKKISNILEGRRGDEYPGNLPDAEEFILDGIAAYMEENYSKELTREKLAEMARMNKYKFSKAFNEKFGKGMKSYLNGIRIKKAVELLKSNKNLSISDVAFFVGYESVSHFNRAFREILGISPKEYRIHHAKSSPQSGHLWALE